MKLQIIWCPDFRASDISLLANLSLTQNFGKRKKAVFDFLFAGPLAQWQRGLNEAWKTQVQKPDLRRFGTQKIQFTKGKMESRI